MDDIEKLKSDIKDLEDEKFTNIVKLLEDLPDNFENCHDKDKVWYDKFNHITDLECEIIHIFQTEKAIEKISIIDKRIGDEARIRHKFTLDQKPYIEILWAREYERIKGVDKYLKNWNKDLILSIWEKKFKECLWHLSLVCQYHKKYCQKVENENADGKE